MTLVKVAHNKMTLGIKPQSWTTLVHLSRVKQTRVKPLSNITNGIIPQCRTSFGMITQDRDRVNYSV